MDELERVGRIAWFAGLPADLRGRLIDRGRLARRAAGEWLHAEGDEETGLAAVLAGGVHLYTGGRDGREVLFGLLPAGGVLGQSVAFGGGPRLVTAICAVDSLVFRIPDRTLREIADQDARLWPAVSGLLYGQLRANVRQIAEFVALKPRQRLISRLVVLSAYEPVVPLAQAALAEIVGVSRNAAHRWLGELERRGAVELGYGWIRVTDRRALTRLTAQTG